MLLFLECTVQLDLNFGRVPSFRCLKPLLKAVETIHCQSFMYATADWLPNGSGGLWSWMSGEKRLSRRPFPHFSLTLQTPNYSFSVFPQHLLQSFHWYLRCKSSSPHIFLFFNSFLVEDCARWVNWRRCRVCNCSNKLSILGSMGERNRWR